MPWPGHAQTRTRPARVRPWARYPAMMESGQQYTHNLQAHEARLQSEDDAQISLTMVNEDLNQ